MKILSVTNYQQPNKNDIGFEAFKIKTKNPHKVQKILGMISEIASYEPASIKNILCNKEYFPMDSNIHYIGYDLEQEQIEKLLPKGENVYISLRDFSEIKNKRDTSNLETTLVKPVKELIDNASTITMRVAKKAYNSFKNQKKLERIAQSNLQIVQEMGKVKKANSSLIHQQQLEQTAQTHLQIVQEMCIQLMESVYHSLGLS